MGASSREEIVGQVHHVKGWAAMSRTDIDDLALACGPDNRLAEKGWITAPMSEARQNGYPRPT